MIDKSRPRYSVTMVKTDTRQYPRYELPEGYSFVFYKPGDEKMWAEIERSLGQFETVEEGINSFNREFVINQNLTPEERILFVKDCDGEYVATAALWDGMFLGERKQRLHWVAVSDKCAGKGIAKALLTRLLDLYNSLGYGDFIYLLTGTWYYPAINLYKKFGFCEYDSESDPYGKLTDEQFKEQNVKALATVKESLEKYKKQ